MIAFGSTIMGSPMNDTVLTLLHFIVRFAKEGSDE